MLIVPFISAALYAQTDTRQVREALAVSCVSPEVVSHQLREFLHAKAPRFAIPESKPAWEAQATKLRKSLLDEVVFRGWPRDWVESTTKFEDLGAIPGGPGYRMRKLRYEIVPGFYSTAILYLPESAGGKAPAILNVNGHVGAPGKAVEYKQKRCINQALQGIVNLNLEWPGHGELTAAENSHWYGAHLDLAGANAVGFFYLAMRRGLDFLYDYPGVDRARIGMTGLSGGGWQTIWLSALDERVFAAVPVAGYSSVLARIETAGLGDIGDIEQNPTDFYTYADYSHLTALRAPRPTLLVYNAEDDCCFRAPLVKRDIFDGVASLFRLFDRERAFGWHENSDPSTHNYQLDNRMQAYRFFARHFGLPEPAAEIPVDPQIKSFDELRVGIPAGNLTIAALARKLAAFTTHPETAAAPADGRAVLKETVRYRPPLLRSAWALANTKNKGLESIAYEFRFDDGLSAAGVWLKAVTTPASAPVTILLNDEGKKAAAADASERLNRGEQVLALDVLFTGDGSPKPAAYNYSHVMSGAGVRPLGMRAAQLIAIANWVRRTNRAPMRIETTGMRSQVTAVIAAALAPKIFSHCISRAGVESLRYLLDKPVAYQNAPELFCFNLLREFDLDQLEAMAAPCRFEKTASQ